MIDVEVEAGRGGVERIRASLVRPATVLVRHRAARLYDPLAGNRLAADAARALTDGGIAAFPLAVVAPVRGEPEDLVTASLLFGSDAPLLDRALVLGTYREAGIPADRLGDVFAGTARRLFGLAA